MSFHTTRRVEFCDTDMAGIVHFANFFRYMEFAEQEFLRARGLSVAWQTGGEHLGFPRVAAACDYARPARFEDLLTIGVELKKLGTKSVTFAFTFTRDGELLARGQMTAVCCRAVPGGAMESVAIPAEVRAKLEAAG